MNQKTTKLTIIVLSVVLFSSAMTGKAEATVAKAQAAQIGQLAAIQARLDRAEKLTDQQRQEISTLQGQLVAAQQPRPVGGWLRRVLLGWQR